ncbi:MAG: tetratricopeptide repeat protein [Crocinitomicaceae bacterium]|nr:tetratricopeptide repeat protein [Crocinitomicaceae bacterium]
MKKALLFVLGGMSMIASAQNMTENKVSFTYIQLPTNPIASQYTQFEIVVVKSFEQSNQDSLTSYQMKLDNANIQYESAMNVWKEQKKNLDRNYLTQLANWEKATNAGTVSTMPVAPTYPLQPVKQDVIQPNMHEDLPADQVNNMISMDGYSKGSGGAKVTLNFKGIGGIKVVETKSGSGTTTKYSYRVEYTMPVEIKVESPSQGVILNTIVLSEVRSYPLKDYASKYEYQLWYLDNQTQLWSELQKHARSVAMQEITTFLNNACGFPTRTWSTEIHSVKSHKDFNYDDLTTAYTTAKQGYDLIYQTRDRKNAHAKLTEAIAMWNKALTESNPNDNKARINDKVTAALYYNIAEAYFWMSNYDQSEQYINKALNAGVMKYKDDARRLQGAIQDAKIRWKANF